MSFGINLASGKKSGDKLPEQLPRPFGYRVQLEQGPSQGGRFFAELQGGPFTIGRIAAVSRDLSALFQALDKTAQPLQALAGFKRLAWFWVAMRDFTGARDGVHRTPWRLGPISTIFLYYCEKRKICQEIL